MDFLANPVEVYITYIFKSIFCFKCPGVKYYNSSFVLMLFLFVLVGFYTPCKRRLANMCVFRGVGFIFLFKESKV